MGADKGIPLPAPTPLPAGFKVPLHTLAAGVRIWTRLGLSTRNPVFFSSSEGNRFFSPKIPAGGLYLGSSPEACFWEVFWESIRTRTGSLLIDAQKLSDRSVFEGSITRDLRVFDATRGPSLLQVGANVVGCFNGDYAIGRTWAEALHQAEPRMEGILYCSARGAGINLVLFGDRVKPKEISLRRVSRTILENKPIIDMLLAEGVGLIS